MTFFEKLEAAIRRYDSLLCVGLDPDPAAVPERFRHGPNPVLAWNRALIDATADIACAYKANSAFYELLGSGGWDTLRATFASVPEGTPVILDAKRGDIGSTAAAYARAAFEVLRADAITVSPYLGGDSVRPFTCYDDRGVFVLCHTSNPGAADLQKLEVGGEPLYLYLARRALHWSDSDNLGFVVGATYPDALRAVRAVAPATWFLVPGVGAQGGDLEAAVAAGIRADGLGILISVSRGISAAPDPRAAALNLRDRIRKAGKDAIHRAPTPTPSPQRGRAGERVIAPIEGVPVPSAALSRFLILRMADLGCVRFGDFTLASGHRSPIYLDLRLLVSDPPALAAAAQLYVTLLERLEYDRLAAIPYAALPIGTTVSLLTGRPLIYPRKEIKEHGTGRSIEGTYTPGERVVVLDDVITTGDTKMQALRPLQAAGLRVEDVVVMVDREQGGAEGLAAHGLRLHAAMRLSEMMDVLATEGRITLAQRDEVKAYIASGRTVG